MFKRTTTRSTLGASCALIAGAIVSFTPAVAQSDDRARYSMAPAEGGSVIRLDKETGEMSVCSNKSGGWACEPMPDKLRDMQRKITRLESELDDARRNEGPSSDDSFGYRGDTVPPDAPGVDDVPPPPGNLRIPTEREVDRLFDYVEGMVKKFQERIDRLKKNIPREEQRTL